MRILLVVHQFLPRHQTGTEIYTYGLAKELSRRHQVYLFYREEGTAGRGFAEEDGEFKGLKVHKVYLDQPADPYRQFLSTFRSRSIERSFSAFLDRVGPDVVHVQHLMNLSGGLVSIAKRRGIPVVMTLHDYWFLCANAQLVRPNRRVCLGTHLRLECADCAAARLNQPKVKLLRPLVAVLFLQRDAYLRRVLREIDLFIAPSLFLREKYVAAGVPERRIVRLEHGTDLGRMRAGRRRDRPGIRFGYIGSLGWQKGVHVLVEAFNGIADDSAELWIFGDPSFFPDYVHRLRELATNPCIRFFGKVDGENIGSVLSELDALIVPSLWYENSPLVIQEAFAAEVPVIASDLGALAEKVRHGLDGLLFPPGDASSLQEVLQGVIGEPAILERLRANIRPVKAMEEHGREVEALYRRLKEGR